MNEFALEPTEEADVVESVSIIEQLTRGEVDMQVATARRWPRSVAQFKREALAMACKSPTVAESCFFVLPRGGKKLEGPSIRLAEIVAVTWGNLRVESRIIGHDDKVVTSQATAWDMQKNVLARREVQRRITDRAGRTFSDDMIVVTGNAAASVALRNAVFFVVPRVYVDEICDHCKRVAAGDRGSLDDAKRHWFGWFQERGIKRDLVLELLGRAGPDDMIADDITTLQGLSTALAEGQTTLEELFGDLQVRQTNGVKKFGFKARQAAAQEAEAAQAEVQPDESK